MSDPSRFTLTIHITEGSTPLQDPFEDILTGETSGAGHMWYSIQEVGKDAQNYGFAPAEAGKGIGSAPGKVFDTDNGTYYKPRYTRKMEITPEQYEKLKEFGENGVREKWEHFDGQYNALTNSCVDFTWNALKHAELEVAGLLPNSKRAIPSSYEGQLIPSSNWEQVKRLVAPKPDSEHNLIHDEGKTRKLKEAVAEKYAEAKTSLPIPIQTSIPESAPPAEPLQKRSYPTSFSEASPPPNTMHRLIQAHTPAKDALWAVSLTGREALSSLYRFTVRFKSDSADLDCQAMIGELCALELETDQQGKRWLSGQMIDFAAVGHEGRHWVYEATVAPKLWHASHRADFRIWQNQTVPDIIYQVLGDNSVRFDMRLKSNYKTWTYLVQYRESDLNFILRQLEHEGIFFWFEHAENGETLVLADHFTSHPECPGYANVPYYSGVQTRPDQDHFDGWRLTRRVETGRLIHTDYDFERPSSDLTTEHADPRGHQFDQYERFHYPGDYIDTKDGDQYAANTLERLQRGQETIHLSGRVRGAAPGHRLTLSEHPRADQNRELTLTAVTYDIADNDYEATDGSTETRFRVDVEAIPADRPFRPPLTTPKPRTRGVETAVVVGPPGEEIHTDEYGRVKVHFHWDRYGKRDGSDTCWVRVAFPWAGSNFGAIHIPRIGQEVIVDFEHGDPDRPIITGRVYNAEQMPPWDLPANQTQSGILTRSSKGGAAGAGMRDGVGDANALRFEDKKGQEQVWFHAQKDYLTEVENDESKWVGNDRRKEIDRDEFNTIHRDRTEEVDRNEKINVHGWRKEEVDMDETITVHKNRKKTVDLNEKVHIGKTKTENIVMAYMQNVGMGRMENVGLGYSLNVGMAMNTVVGLSQTSQVGRSKNTKVGKHYTLEAGESITLKTGKSVLVMKSDGTVTLNGKTIDVVGDKHVQIDSKRIDLN